MPEVGKLQLEIRTQAIKLLPGRNLTEASKQVKACHVFTGTEQIGVMRKALNKIYGSRNKEGFPLGKHMRFVPNIADNSIPTTTLHSGDHWWTTPPMFLASPIYGWMIPRVPSMVGHS